MPADAVAGTVAAISGTATPDASVPAVTAARITRVTMFWFVRIESSRAKAKVRSLGRGTRTARDSAVASSLYRLTAFFLH
jgi:hypothetical protein